MRTYYAVKPLTASDLGFFKYHFQQGITQSNQKSINLNARPFRTVMYPAVREGEDYPIDLRLLGPVTAPEYRLRRNIRRSDSSKNWRLNGEFIPDPDDLPDRFHRLAPGDYAILKFEGDERPERVRCVLVSVADLPAEHAATTTYLTQDGGSARGMRLLSREDVLALWSTFTGPGLPADMLLDEELKEELEVGGGIPGGRPPKTRRRLGRGRQLDRSEVEAVRDDLAETGRLGESLFAAYLDELRRAGDVRSYRWVSLEYAYAPYDFEVVRSDGTELEVEVKSTRNGFGRKFFLSLAEAVELVEAGEAYELVRVYDLTEEGAKFRVVTDLGGPVAAALKEVDAFPGGLGVPAITVDPGVVGLSGPETVLRSEALTGETDSEGIGDDAGGRETGQLPGDVESHA